jgi:hypothetical protein
MRPRTELLLGLGGLALIAVLAGVLGQRRNRVPSEDPRRSTFLTGPNGARGLADALERLGIQVKRYRQRAQALEDLPDGPGPRVLAVLDPYEAIRGPEVQAFLDFASRPTDLILAGDGTERLMRCFGYVPQESAESAQVAPPGVSPDSHAPWVHAVLSASSEAVAVDSSGAKDATVVSCSVPAVASIDTLLVARTGRVEALRIHRGDVAGSVTVVADGALFSNRALRESEAGPFALGLIVGRYDRVLFEESHQEFGTHGSLAGATLDWSRRSPLGWAVWQLAIVGALALLMGAVRFGPPRRAIPRTRRSPLEHVRALATALAAAHGHDVAVDAIVRGLRRRAGGRSREAMGEWLHSLGQNVRSSRAQEAVRTLQDVTRPGQPGTSVLRAANAVEDVWEDLRP